MNETSKLCPNETKKEQSKMCEKPMLNANENFTSETLNQNKNENEIIIGITSKEKNRRKARLYYQKNKDHARQQSLSYYHANRDVIRERRKLERANPSYRIKRRKREETRKYIDMRRSYHLTRNYGIDLKTEQQMMVQQNGKCAICLRAFHTMRNRDKHVDHNHKTGKVRQLLCTQCNCAIGNLQEDVTRFERAVAYLKKWEVENESSIW